MHCEKNLCENMVKTLLAMNDNIGSRVDAQLLHIHEEIWLQDPCREQDDYYMRDAPYTMTAVEQREFMDVVSNIRTPTNYVSAIHKRFEDGKLQYMKTHNYHIVMQQVSAWRLSSLLL